MCMHAMYQNIVRTSKNEIVLKNQKESDFSGKKLSTKKGTLCDSLTHALPFGTMRIKNDSLRKREFE